MVKYMTGLGIFEVAVSVAAAVTLFIYALKGFGDDVQRVGGIALRGWVERMTAHPLKAFLLGAGATALVQSSSAVASITVTLVQAGAITFRGSLPVFLGANVGTTTTAWLVSLDAAIIGPFLIVLSAVLSVLPARIALFGRAVFYLGVVLLALQLVSSYVSPLKQLPELAEWLAYAQNPAIGLLIGIIATALLQSSSVIIGLAVIAVQQGFIGATDIVPIILGANIGTTSTALVASIDLGPTARHAAIANLLFNTAGVLVFLPFLGPFQAFIMALTSGGVLAVATTHLLFNIGVALLGFSLIAPIARLLGEAAAR